ncbi:MAG: tRNA (adenosine(37)-N6)-threonylcarbamoyltransferase complex ATPase subunit type 1 TsaE, partial [Thermodesulfovibrionales bacterium]
MIEKRLTLISNSEKETFEIGKRLGNLLKKSSIICLYGGLGSGKTVFIKGLASAFGIPPREIGSASFVLAAEYPTEPPFFHIDLYRIECIENEDWIWDYIDKGTCAI